MTSGAAIMGILATTHKSAEYLRAMLQGATRLFLDRLHSTIQNPARFCPTISCLYLSESTLQRCPSQSQPRAPGHLNIRGVRTRQKSTEKKTWIALAIWRRAPSESYFSLLRRHALH
ncbi:hypothetical protein Dimus_033481 [Dionaea muscipula]